MIGDRTAILFFFFSWYKMNTVLFYVNRVEHHYFESIHDLRVGAQFLLLTCSNRLKFLTMSVYLSFQNFESLFIFRNP